MKRTKAGQINHRPRWGRRLAWVAVAVVVGIALVTTAANVLIRLQVRPFLHVDPLELSAPVAIVPGASVHRDGSPSRQLEDRLSAALSLIRAGQVQLVLVSGARAGAYDEAGPMRHWLIQHGVRPRLVIDDHAGFRTLDTMERAAHVYAIKQAIVCTQAFHLPRAVFLARRAGIDAVGLAVDGVAARISVGDTLRESLATILAVVDSYLLRRQPRERGSPVPVLAPNPGG